MKKLTKRERIIKMLGKMDGTQIIRYFRDNNLKIKNWPKNVK